MNGIIEYQIIHDILKIKEVEEFQEKIWSQDAVSPVPQLVANIHNGGIIVGAYSEEQLVGFCYGFPGYKDGQIYLVSHMMGIDPEYRNLGIGHQLKWKQREWALKQGYEKIVWTFDPLESRNAYLNLNKLKGHIRTYTPNYYGIMNDDINKGLPADRFLLEWDIKADPFVKKREGIANCEIPKLIDYEFAGLSFKPKKNNIQPSEEAYLVAVPHNIHELKKDHLKIAEEWRYILRETFIDLFANGYFVLQMIKGNGHVNFYAAVKIHPENN